MAAKLHEILAVQGALKGTADKVLAEARVTFDKKENLFLGSATNQTFFATDDQHLAVNEAKEMTTTVMEKLEYVAPIVSRFLDVYLQKEATNQAAKADVVIDDATILKDMPATALLGLETHLKQIRSIYDAIPTLQAGPHWEQDPNKAKGVYRARDPEVRFVTRKVLTPIIMAPATKEHPAQVNAISEDVKVGKNEITTWSGMMSSADKSDLLERVDKLLRAVKYARQRANGQTVVAKKELGKTIFDYINEGVLSPL